VAELWRALEDTGVGVTYAMEVPGVGVVLRAYPSNNMVVVPGARVQNGRVVRDARTSPPLYADLDPSQRAEIAMRRVFVEDEEPVDFG